MPKILLEIDCGDFHCNECEFLDMHFTGIAGEFHPKCVVFVKAGDWGKENMRRPKECLSAEKKASKP